MKWKARAGDWAAGLGMLAVLVIGGSIAFGAPLVPDLAKAPASETRTIQASPTTTPSAQPSPAETKSPRARPRPKPDSPKSKVKVKDVPDSGSGMEIILPGTGILGDVEPTVVDVVISSFNVLGASHTVGGGEKPQFATGTTRARWAAQLVTGHDVDIVGLQELQPTQMHVMMKSLPGYDIFPGASLGRKEAVNSIMWRSDEWTAVQKSTIAIPYFYGRTRQMPYVRLRHRETGTDIWVANFHNPADSHGNASRWRAEATRREIALANMLRDKTGLPVVFTGDFNERELLYCRLAGNTALESSTGGSADQGRCSPPGRSGIDWIFGTPELEWLGSVTDKGALVRRTTDHPMVVAKAQLSVLDSDAVDEATKGLDRVEGSLGNGKNQ